MPLQIIRQDISKIRCDAIVNPTNEDLLPGGGTDAAIHAAAGAELLNVCKAVGKIKIGEAVMTPAFQLPCKYVIHTAPPLWEGGEKGEEEKLRSCYRAVLHLAEENGCESLALPLISSCTPGYPKDRVFSVALSAVREFLFSREMMVYLAVSDKKSYSFSKKLFADIPSYINDQYVFAAPSRNKPSVGRMSRRMEDPLFPLCDCLSTPILDKSALEGALHLDESFSVKLLKLIDAKGMDEVSCYKRANVSKQTWYKILNEKNYKPNKKTVLSFAIALCLDLEKTQELLASVGFTLSRSSLFDVIVMYCIEKEIYDVLEIDSVLFQYDQETLFSKA